MKQVIRCIDVEVALMQFLDIRQNVVVPNLTTASGLVEFETDMLMLSTSSYASAFEIKVSRSDLKNDTAKRHFATKMQEASRLKYFFKRIKYFYYVVPESLEADALAQIPDYCGLYVIHVNRNRLKPVLKRKPKQINAYKWTEEERYQLCRLGTMRILTLKKALSEKLRAHRETLKH